MITKEQKQTIIQELLDKFKIANGYYLVDFSGMTVETAKTFRRALKAKGYDYKVAKNTLILRALAELGENPVPEKAFFGQTGVVFTYDDPVTPAKIIKEQSEKTNIPKLKGAVIEGKFFDGSKLKEIAALPTKQDIMASIVGSLHAPVSGIVGSINAVLRDVASLIEEVAKQKAA